MSGFVGGHRSGTLLTTTEREIMTQEASPPAGKFARRALIVAGIIIAIVILVVAGTPDADAPHGGHPSAPANSSSRAAG